MGRPSGRRLGPTQPVGLPFHRPGTHEQTANTKPRIGFIGLGLMGHGIAKNLVTKGFPLTVRVHRNRKPLEDLLAAGAKEVTTNAEVARALRHRVPVRDRHAAGRGDRLRRQRPARGGARRADRRRHVDARAGVDRGDPRGFRRQARRFVDAPLARTPMEAEQGRLNIMVGADDAMFAQLKPVLAAFCENIIHAGPPGHGLMLKLINNFIAQAIATATAEAVRRRGQVRPVAARSCTR